MTDPIKITWPLEPEPPPCPHGRANSYRCLECASSPPEPAPAEPLPRLLAGLAFACADAAETYDALAVFFEALSKPASADAYRATARDYRALAARARGER